MACKPAMTMIRLTTTASTGLLIKRSVIVFIWARGLLWVIYGRKIANRIRDDRRLALGGLRLQFHLGLQGVIHHHRHFIAQLEDAGGGHDLPGLQALRNRDE